jgi:hypothetical protein
VIWLRRFVAGLSPQRLGFEPVSVHVGFVADIGALGQDCFSELFGFLLSVSFHHGSPYSYITWGMNRPVGGRSSETQHPIDVNNTKIVRFQVLTAASMMFRIVFWDILLIPDYGGSTHL